MADRQRTYTVSLAALLLRFLPGRISGMGSFQVWQPGETESDMGNRFLEPNVHGFQPDSSAIALGRRSQSRAGARLQPLPVLRQRILPARATRHAPAEMSQAFCDHKQCGIAGRLYRYARALQESRFCRFR